jgi:hypothetical protein
VHGLLLHGINTTDFFFVIVVVVLASFGACKPQAKFARELTLVGYGSRTGQFLPTNQQIGDGPKKMDQSETSQYYSTPTTAPCRMDGWIDG